MTNQTEQREEPVGAKVFFQKVRDIDRQIAVKYEQLLRLNALSTKVTASLDGEGHGGGGVSRSMENGVMQIVALQEELEQDIEGYTSLYRQANAILRRMEDTKERVCLEHRYLLGRTWEEIAEEMGISYQWVSVLHGKALKSADEIIFSGLYKS